MPFMADEKLFVSRPDLDRIDTHIVEAGKDGDRPWVRLEQTIFYPEAGGQPADRGTIQGVGIIDVEERGGCVLHFVERPLEPGPVTAVLDQDRRLDHCQQHTAQHLITAWLLAHQSMPTTSFHLGETYSSIDVDGPVPDASTIERFEDGINSLVRENRKVTVTWADPGDMERLGVRSRRLPAGHVGKLRLVGIEGVDLNTCGGTHVQSLAELQIVHLTGAQGARGGARIFFLAGNRVMARLRATLGIEAELKKRLGTAPDRFAQVIDGWHDEKRMLERRIAGLEAQASSQEAQRLALTEGPLIAKSVQGADPERLRALARAILDLRPEAVVVLAGESGDPPVASFIVQSGERGPNDVSALGSRVRDVLGAKGGGRGRLFMGRGGRVGAGFPPDGLSFPAR